MFGFFIYLQSLLLELLGASWGVFSGQFDAHVRPVNHASGGTADEVIWFTLQQRQTL